MMLRMSPNARVLRARSKTIRDKESHGWREESSVENSGVRAKEFMTGVLLGNTSEQSGDCSYELLGLIYHRYLVRAPLL